LNKIAIISVALSIALLTFSLNLIRGCEEKVVDALSKDRGDIVISANAAFDPVEVLKHLPKSVVVRPTVETYGLAVRMESYEAVLVRGVETDNFGDDESKIHVILGERLSKKLGVCKGDVLSLTLPVKRLMILPVQINCVVRDIAKHDLDEMDRFGIIVNLKSLQKILNFGDNVTSIACFTKNIRDAIALLPKLKEALKHHIIHSWHVSASALSNAMRTFRTLIMILFCALILLATLSLCASMTMLIHDNKLEICVLRSFGATKKNIVSIFMRVGGLLFAVGVSIGLFIGVILTINVNYVVNVMQYLFGVKLDFGLTLFQTLPSQIYWFDLLLIFGISSIINFCSVLIAIYKACNNVIANELN
jgi:lipoprotein-releasing system permease protein